MLSTGVEIVRARVEVAKSMAKKHSVESVEFMHGDLLESDLSNTGILVLTSQCWDDDLKTKVFSQQFRVHCTILLHVCTGTNI